MRVKPGLNSLKNALKKAKENGIKEIFLENGVHDEQGERVVIDFPITIIGESKDGCIIIGTKASGSLTHRDETSSLLYVVTGSKIVYLAPPGAEVKLKMAIKDLLFLDYNPDNDTRRNKTPKM